MTKIFGGPVPGIENLPLTQKVIDSLNRANSSGSADVQAATIEALILSTALLENRLNALMKAVGATVVEADSQ